MRLERFLICVPLALGAGCGLAGDPPELGGTDGQDDDDNPEDDGQNPDDDDGPPGGPGTGGPDTNGGSESDGETDGDEETGDTGEVVDHALGIISLAEAHPAGGGVASGSVSAAFIPDASKTVVACTETVAGCAISIVPECASGCGEEQYCGWSDGCASTCLDVCDASCADDEVCYFAAPGQSACRVREDFDAGALSFTGTTIPITLFPPYVAEGFDNGSPFSPGSEVSIDASGATAAGFVEFNESFTTTTLLQSDLDEVTVGEAYGEGDVPLRWVAGTDDVEVTVTVTALDGAYGTVTCSADDSAGNFDVPRAALLAAVDGEAAASLAVSITRSRTEVVEGLTTTGELLHAEVYPDAWLELSTISSESIVVEGCGFGELVCGDDCVDVLWDSDNCGGCGEVCGGECYDGECLVENNDTTCDDGLDNDGDGYYDCDDFDCSMNPSVTVCEQSPENNDVACDDGLDNDGDGYYDCDDFDCSMNPAVTVCEGVDMGGSCVGNCGADDVTCFCDADCTELGDCCQDYEAVCG